MRDAATAAAMSDPTMNRWFSRRWVEPAVEPPPAETAPVPALDLNLLGRGLLAAWRRERAAREARR